jgi:predicted secreted Zn-dependent protease
MDWNLRPQSTADGRCRTAEVRIDLRGEMLLPRLRGGSRAQQQRFDDYLSRPARTRAGAFRNRAAKPRARWRRVLYAAQPARSCAELQSAARAEGARLLQKYEAMGDTYDRQTEHGRTQGAVAGRLSRAA